MGRFTNPRDLYFGEGARHEVKNLKGKRAIIVSGGSSMRRGASLMTSRMTSSPQVLRLLTLRVSSPILPSRPL